MNGSPLLAWALGAALAYGAACLIARRALYVPMRHPRGEWDRQTLLGASDVFITTEDGVQLHAWWAGPPQNRLVTLHLHGKAGNITHRAALARELVRAGSSVLLLDYRGYGKSAGHPGESALTRDAEAAFDFLVSRGIAAHSIVLHGESLGAAVAVELATRRPCAGIVLDAPFTTLRAAAAVAAPIAGPLVLWGFPTLERIGRIGAPVLIIHGALDRVAPWGQGRELFAAAPEPKYFWTVEGAGHDDILLTAGVRYRDRVAEFYRTLPAPPIVREQ